MINPNTPHKRLTLRDVAKAIGVSHVTVSLALRNAPQVSVARRKQIQEVARSMGYRPHQMATAMGQQRHRTISKEIAWLNARSHPEQLRSFKEFDAYWRGAAETATYHGYHLTEFCCGGWSSAELWENLNAKHICGLLLPPHDSVPASWNLFPWEKYWSIRFGYSIAYPQSHIVTSNQLRNSVMAWENIERLGYKRIAFATSQGVKTQFKAGFLMKQLELEEKERIPILFLPADPMTQKSFEMTRHWLEKYHPDAIITDIAAMADVMKKIACRVPEDCGLAALSVLDGNADAGIYQNSEEIGRIAMEMLIFEMNHSHFGIPKIPREILIDGKWVNGKKMPSKVLAELAAK